MQKNAIFMAVRGEMVFPCTFCHSDYDNEGFKAYATAIELFFFLFLSLLYFLLP